MSIQITGPWNKGLAFALHTTSSTYLGADDSGHDRFDNVRSEMGELVYRLKYKRDRSALPHIVTLLDTIGGLETFDMFLPIPPTDKSRAFQPVNEIASALGAKRGVAVRTDILLKKAGGAQLKNVDDPVERERLLRESIYVHNRGDLAGKRVLLVDDLYRSGATHARSQGGWRGVHWRAYDDEDAEQIVVSGTVFLSGSRKISRLNDRIRNRIDIMLAKHLHIVVGDANGADKAVQAYLAEKDYPSVTVYCAKGQCRNNLGGWQQKAVPVPPGFTGRDFYTQKDVAMAEDADYGLVLWDGKSVGSINNVIELLKRRKVVVVYLSPKQEFATLKGSADLTKLVGECDPMDRETIRNKTSLDRMVREIGTAAQRTLELR